MQILFIANAIVGKEPGLTGGEARFIEIAKSWAKHGHKIHLMSSSAGAKLCRKLGLEVVLHNLSDSKRIGRVTLILRTLKSLFFLPASMKDFREGIVYSTNEMIFDVIPALRLKLRYKNRIKWAVVVHWLPPFPPWRRRQSTVLNSTLFFINERISVWLANWFADVLLPVSHSTAKQLSKAGIKMSKVSPVECGVNYEEIRDISQDIKEKKYDAVFMKRLQAVKGIFDLIEIWELVVKIKPEAQLLIIGEGIDGRKAEEMVRGRGLAENIHFAGIIYDPTEKFKKLAESKLFVLPTYEENWAIVIGEAMACGTPVICYDLKELIEVWGNNVIQIALGDKVAFARRIVALLDDPSALSQRSLKGREYVRRYDWQAIAATELKIILG